MDRCASTFEVALDQSRVDLLGAMTAERAVRQLVPFCGTALQQLEPKFRGAAPKRFGALRGRLAANHEFVELDRRVISLGIHGWLLTEEQRSGLPAPRNYSGSGEWVRYFFARSWARHDRALRALVAIADANGAARDNAVRTLDSIFEGWWLPDDVRGPSNYEKCFLRNEDRRALLHVLAQLAEGADKDWPRQVSRVDGGLEFTDSQMRTMLIPLLDRPVP